MQKYPSISKSSEDLLKFNILIKAASKDTIEMIYTLLE